MTKISCEVEYDPAADCAYIYVKPRTRKRGVVKRSVESKIAPVDVFGSIVFDVNDAGHVVGIEVLGVSTIWPGLKVAE